MSNHPPEFPRKLRHYFKVELPEDLRAPEKNDTQAGWMDVIVDTSSTPIFTVTDFGCVFQGEDLRRPEWMREQLESQFSKICLK